MTFFVEQLNIKSDQVTHIAQTETLDDALAIAKWIIDEYLERNRSLYDVSADARYSASADVLYTSYQESGLIPCIFCDNSGNLEVQNFDHLHYASLECLRLCRDIQGASKAAAPMIKECV